MYRMILNETSYFGAGCRESIAIEAARRGFKKAFFVTDKDLIRFKVADKVIEVFEKNNIPYASLAARPAITATTSDAIFTSPMFLFSIAMSSLSISLFTPVPPLFP